MSVVGAIARANITRLLRDRLGLFFIVVLPLLIILLFGVAGGGGPTRDAPVGLVNAAQGPLAGALDARLRDAPGLVVTDYPDREALTTALRRGTESAGLVVPAGYDDAVEEGRSVEIELLSDPTGALPGAVRAAAGAAVAAESSRLQAAGFAAAELGMGFDEALALADRVGGGQVTSVTETAAADGEFVALDHSASGNLVLFVFITSLVGSTRLIETRRLGVSRRMLAAPTTAGTVLAGEALARFLVAAGQAAIVLVGAAWLFGARWGDPAAVAAVVVLFCLVGTGAAMLLGALFSTAEQAGGIGAPLGIGLGMLGGCMWPLEIVGPTMSAIGHLTPHAWAMDALRAVVREGGGLAAVTGELAVLAVYAAVLLAGASVLLRRAIVR